MCPVAGHVPHGGCGKVQAGFCFSEIKVTQVDMAMHFSPGPFYWVGAKKEQMEFDLNRVGILPDEDDKRRLWQGSQGEAGKDDEGLGI